GLTIPCLSGPDRVGFAALHVLRHVFHNNVRLSHVFELARMLESCSTESARSRAGLATFETAAFRFAHEWFSCRWPAAIEEQWQSLPANVHLWFEKFAYSPLTNLFEPNKDVVWLHSALASRSDRLRILVGRLFPMRIPDRAEATGSAYMARVFRRAWY